MTMSLRKSIHQDGSTILFSQYGVNRLFQTSMENKNIQKITKEQCC